LDGIGPLSGKPPKNKFAPISDKSSKDPPKNTVLSGHEGIWCIGRAYLRLGRYPSGVIGLPELVGDLPVPCGSRVSRRTHNHLTITNQRATPVVTTSHHHFNSPGYSGYGLEAVYQGHTGPELAIYPSPLLERFCWTLSEWLQEYLIEGWTAYLATFKFKQLAGPRHVVLQKMLNEIDRLYSTFSTRVVRHPRSKSQRQLCPILLVAPDLPVPRCQRTTSNDLINDGLHYHGILLVPALSRLKVSAIEHFANKKELYVKNCLLELDVRPIDRNLPKVVHYIFKSITRGRFSWEDWRLFGPTG
jgi:hypothetical protein